MQNQKWSLSTFVDLTRFEHSLFGLPFIFAGALLPFALQQVAWTINWLWLIPAFLAARISGMAFNQLIDRDLDAHNPRTQNRPLPSGRATLRQARWIAWSGLLAFVLICSQINTLCFFLAPCAACLIYIYAYLKRFHVICHFVLGIVHFLGPVMASIAIAGQWHPETLLLGLAALGSISGLDIVYAIQDYKFDRSHGLYSLPARLGLSKSLDIAKCLHVLTVLALVVLGCVTPLASIYWGAPLAAALLFLDFHQKIKPLVDAPELSLKITPLFFRCNVSVALSTFLFVTLGVFLCRG